MILKNLDIRSFGKFSNANISELNSDINIIYGKNEAGKTTLYNLIQTLLYGFTPANIEKHPYASYHNNTIDFSGTIIHKEETYLIERRLGSVPKGHYFNNEKKHNLRNEPLPLCNHISKAVYRGLYTLSEKDINDLDTTLWDSIEDKLLSNYGVFGIKNPREIIGDINKDIDKLYKKSKRGKSEIKELKERLKYLRKERKTILVKEREIRDVDREKKSAMAQLTTLKEKRYSLESILNELELLMPINDIQKEIEAIESKLKDYDVYMGAPVDIEQKYNELLDEKKELEKKSRDIVKKIDNHKSKIVVIEETDTTIIENISRIRGLAKEIDRFDGRKSINLNRDLELRKIKKNINEELYNIFYGELSNDVIEKINRMSKHSILNKISKLKSTKEMMNQLEMKLNLLNDRPENNVKLSIIYLLALLLSPISLVGRHLSNTTLQIIGVLAAVIGCFGLFNYLSLRKSNAHSNGNEKALLQSKIDKLSLTIEELNKNISAEFGGIPIKPEVLHSIDEGVIKTIMRMKELYLDLSFVNEDIARFNDDQRALESDIKEMLGIIGIHSSYNLEEEIKGLLHRYDYIKERIESNRDLELKIKELMRENHINDKELSSCCDRLKSISIFIDKGTENDQRIVFEDIKEMHRLMNSLSVYRDKLSIIPEKEAKIDRIARLDHPVNISYKGQISQKLSNTIDTIGQTEVIIGRCDERLNNYISSRLDDIDSDIMVCEDEIAVCIDTHDRLRVISEFIRYTDKSYKELNQPDIIMKASSYFERMTRGRYTNMYIDSTNDSREIYLKARDSMVPVSAKSRLSKGTINQLYLSIRLGIIESLEKDGIKLPIILDELFSNWDEDRLDETLEVIKEIADERQFVLFTCNPWMATKFKECFETECIIL